MMSITPNHSDFQCLQDQLVELKTKNYELTEKIRRSQADFEAAKGKICTLQLKLEEQERDFQNVSSILRREIEAVTSTNNEFENDYDGIDDFEHKYKKVVKKAKELQQAYEKTVAVVQQMNAKNEELSNSVAKLEEENIYLKKELELEKKTNASPKQLEQESLQLSPIDQVDSSTETSLPNIEELKAEIDRLKGQLTSAESLNETQTQELKIMERKGAQTVKELKRQLALEKNRTGILQGRLENLLKEPQTTITSANLDFHIHSKLSTSSSINDGKDSNTSLDNSNNANIHDSNSVGSWSFVPASKEEPAISQQPQMESMSGCSTVAENKIPPDVSPVNCDNRSEISSTNFFISTELQDHNNQQNIPSPLTINTSSTHQQDNSSLSLQDVSLANKSLPSGYLKGNLSNNSIEGMLIEEQAALVDRLTKMQHDKWMLEEKLSYLELANSSLSEDLANKSDIIKHYFIDQALKAGNYCYPESKSGSLVNTNNNPRLNLWTPSLNNMNNDKSSLKKVVDFLKERSQISLLESDNISREATKKMQLMLEETLTKCLKLQENLDYVTSELNKLKS